MRNQCITVLSGANNASANGTQIDASQMFSASFHLTFPSAVGNGTLKIQGSNDINPSGMNKNNFTVTNWTDIASASAATTSGASKLITLPQLNYQFIRPVWTTAAVQATKVIQDLTVTAILYGTSGNSITVTYIDPATPSHALEYAEVGNAITITLSTDGGGAPNATATEINTLINANSTLITSAVSGTGSNVQAATGAQTLAGGVGSTTVLTVNMNSQGF